MAVLMLHVHGEASIWSGTGALGVLEELGVSVDGASISINTRYEDVMVDTYGPKTPFDVQYFLQDAIIKCDLVYYDLDVLDKWLVGAPGASPTQGLMGSAGGLVVQEGLARQLVIKSTPSNIGLTGADFGGGADQEQCYNFPQCILLDGAEVKLGTEKKVWKLTWRALLSQQTSTSFGAILYNDTCE